MPEFESTETKKMHFKTVSNYILNYGDKMFQNLKA